VVGGFISCQTQTDSSTLTFEKDIKPIIQKNCSGCHNPDGFAPFDLLTFQDVSKRAGMIVEVTESGYMPPWYADTTFSSFANQRRISHSEILQINKWISDGKRKGGLFPSKIKVDQTSSLFTLEKLSISPLNPIIIRGDNREHFIKIIIPFNNDSETQVQGISFKPGSKKYAHHANYAIFETPQYLPLESSYPIFEAGINEAELSNYAKIFGKQVHYSGWVPGSSPVDFGEGNGFILPKKGVVLLTMHYSSAPTDFNDLPTIHFYKTENKITHIVKTISLGSGGIGTIYPDFVIPPNEISSFTLLEEVPVALELLYIWPHMHYLGKSFKVEIINPQNDTVPLIRINKWDFDWQEGYQLLEPLAIAPGSKILIKAEYDNTAQNPRNPHSPPKEVESTGFMESEKEMMTLVLIYRDLEKK
jgi:hypothetical protein